jgi:acyl-coenzyme A thioesterase PaaI-like protein
MNPARKSAIASVRAIATQLRAAVRVSDQEAEALLALRSTLGPASRPPPPPAGRNWQQESAMPFLPDVTYRVDTDGFRGSLRFDPVFEGTGGVAHGGFVAVAFDTALGAAALARTICRTASLTVEYRAPIPVERDLTLTARVERTEGRKLWVSGQITDPERLYAEARGLWVAVASYEPE